MMYDEQHVWSCLFWQWAITVANVYLQVSVCCVNSVGVLNNNRPVERSNARLRIKAASPGG